MIFSPTYCKSHLRTSSVVAVILLLTGCGDLLKQPYPNKLFFSIEPGLPDKPAVMPVAQALSDPAAVDRGGNLPEKSTLPKMLLVRAVRVSPPYDGLALVYRDGSSQYEKDYYANWIASPSELFTGGLTSWLSRTGPWVVVPSGSALQADYLLDCEVTNLSIDRSHKAQPQAGLSLRVFVSKVTNGGAALLLNNEYTSTIQVKPDDPQGYSLACGKAFRNVLEKLSFDLTQSAH